MTVINEYLVAIGFKDALDQLTRFNDAVMKVELRLAKLGVKVLGATAAVGAMVTKVADDYNDLYIKTFLVGESAEALRAFSFGARQIGESTEQAVQSLTRFNTALLANPAQQTMLNMLGIATAGRTTDQMMDDFIDKMAHYNPMMAARWAEMIGMQPEELFLKIKERGVEQKEKAWYQRRRHELGLDDPTFIAKSHKFWKEEEKAFQGIKFLGEQVADLWIPKFSDATDKTTELIESLEKAEVTSNLWDESLDKLGKQLAQLDWLKEFIKILNPAENLTPPSVDFSDLNNPAAPAQEESEEKSFWQRAKEWLGIGGGGGAGGGGGGGGRGGSADVSGPPPDTTSLRDSRDIDRSVFKEELEKDPALAARLAGMIKGEVGLGSKVSREKQIIELETLFNRAQVRRTSLRYQLYNGYYPGTPNTYVSPEEVEWFKKYILSPVASGSNLGAAFVGVPPTGNASQLAFAGRRADQGYYTNWRWWGDIPGGSHEMFVLERSDAERMLKHPLPRIAQSRITPPKVENNYNITQKNSIIYNGHEPDSAASSFERVLKGWNDQITTQMTPGAGQ